MVEASLHLAFGLGTGWMLTDAMFIEAAHMGQTQPEGLALATYLTGSGMIANVVVVPFFLHPAAPPELADRALGLGRATVPDQLGCACCAQLAW